MDTCLARNGLLIVALGLALAGCASRQKGQLPKEAPAPRVAPSPSSSAPHPYVPRPATPLPPGRPFPECDPRAGDVDREHVALGLLAGDCQDDRGHNRVYVTRLMTVKGEASPAGRAGLLPGDRLVRIDACEILTTHGLAAQLRKAVPGWVARVVIERGGRDLEVFVPSVGLAPRSEPPAAAHLSTAGCSALGRKPAQP